VVSAPTQTASHTYSSAGTYTVTLTAKDTGGLTSAPVTKSITVTADAPPVAKLAVTASGLTANATAAGSTDTDSTPIGKYSFDWGDGSNATVVNAPTQTASHTYASGGTYTVTLIATDTANNASAPVTASVTVSSGGSGGGGVSVYAGYYDTHHPDHLRTKPNPWLGASNVVFVGVDDDGKGNWDSCGLRIDNNGSSSLSGVVVTCDIGSNHYALWGSRSIPAGSKLLLAQTAFQNFDGSDTSPAGCYGCDPKLCLTEVVSTIPVIHVTINGVTTNYYDNTQVLNTGGADLAGCPDTGGTRNDESTPWTQISTSSAKAVMAGADATSGEPPVEKRQLALAAPVPNPAKDDAVLHFTVPELSRVHIAIYDVAGRLVQTWLDRDMGAGSYQQVVSVRGVSVGVYYCTLTTVAGTVTRPVVVSR